MRSAVPLRNTKSTSFVGCLELEWATEKCISWTWKLDRGPLSLHFLATGDMEPFICSPLCSHQHLPSPFFSLSHMHCSFYSSNRPNTYTILFSPLPGGLFAGKGKWGQAFLVSLPLLRPQLRGSLLSVVPPSRKEPYSHSPSHHLV